MAVSHWMSLCRFKSWSERVHETENVVIQTCILIGTLTHRVFYYRQPLSLFSLTGAIHIYVFLHLN